MHRADLPCKISKVDIPDSGYVFFVYLSGEKVYTAVDKTMYVYLVSDTTSPIATYSLRNVCFSGLIKDNRLYLGEK